MGVVQWHSRIRIITILEGRNNNYRVLEQDWYFHPFQFLVSIRVFSNQCKQEPCFCIPICNNFLDIRRPFFLLYQGEID